MLDGPFDASAAAPGPLYARIADQVRDDVLRGRLREGDRLTSTTQYAVQLGVNPATAARALADLVAEGTAEKQRGVGFFVRPGARERLRERRARAYVPAVLDPALAEADLLGVDGEELLAHVRRHVEARGAGPHDGHGPGDGHDDHDAHDRRRTDEGALR